MNPIQQWLDARGFPWCESMSALAGRYGTRPDPWFENRLDIVAVDSRPPLLPGLLRPPWFSVRPDFDPALPPLSLSAYCWSGRRSGWILPDRARGALRMVHDALAPALGPAERYDTSNTYGWRWESGPARIEIICFPPHLQRHQGRNSVHEAEPRAATACHVNIETGYRPECTARERAQVGSFVPHVRLGDGHDPARVATARVSQAILEYVRAPCPGFEVSLGRLGASADGETLIFTTGELHLVPRSDADHVHVERLAPARGSGGAFVSLACRNGTTGALKRIGLTGGYGEPPDARNDEARRIADRLGIPCILGDYALDD